MRLITKNYLSDRIMFLIAALMKFAQARGESYAVLCENNRITADAICDFVVNRALFATLYSIH